MLTLSLMQKKLHFLLFLFFIGITLFLSLNSIAFDLDSLKAIEGVDAKADSFEYIGDNMVAYGNIFIRKGDIIFLADKAIVNNTNKNIEITGNVRLYQLVRSRREMEYWDLRALEKDPNVKLKVVGTVMTPAGRQMLIVDTIKQTLTWQGDRVLGNLITGVFEFGTFQANFGGWTVAANNATRKSDGEILIKNATISPCASFSEGHSVYSLSSGTVSAFPSGGDTSTDRITPLNSRAANINNYHFWAYNNILYIGSVPVFWLPVIYKPPPNRMGLFTITAGSSTYYGAYVQTTNNWTLSDTPDLQINTSNLLDYYNLRGVGYGNATEIATPNSVTQTFMYGIEDERPYTNIPDDSRFNPISPYRYDVDFRNFTHLSDRADFRGRFAKESDIYFLYDYFSNIASVDPEPASYANLNYQFDWSSLNLNIRPQVNTWATTTQELPQLQLTIPRQELLDNLYYQSQTSLAYLDMRWTQFNQPRPGGLPNPANYASGRFDTVNFVYYPIELNDFNIIPRAGFRITGYSKSSEAAVSDQDLRNMISVSQAESSTTATFTNYDTKGGATARFIPEIGLNLNTKLSQSWDGIKSSYWEMDGLRHVAQPYIDYTFLTPSTNPDHILYFDDIDRIDTQNFIRTGIANRLQTRRGGWKSSQVYTWAQMQNYMDFLFNTDARQDEPSGTIKNLGDFGNIITLTPTENLNITAQILVDAGRMISSNFDSCLTSLNTGFTWNFADGWGFTGSYYSSSNNNTNPSYSMGSSLAQAQSGTFFQRQFQNSSYVNAGMNFKINDRTTGNISLQYDFYQNLSPGMGITLSRELPCGLLLVLNASLSQQKANNGVGDHTDQSVSASLQFLSSPTYEITPRESLLPDDTIEEPYIY